MTGTSRSEHSNPTDKVVRAKKRTQIVGLSVTYVEAEADQSESYLIHDLEAAVLSDQHLHLLCQPAVLQRLLDYLSIFG